MKDKKKEILPKDPAIINLIGSIIADVSPLPLGKFVNVALITERCWTPGEAMFYQNKVIDKNINSYDFIGFTTLNLLDNMYFITWRFNRNGD